MRLKIGNCGCYDDEDTRRRVCRTNLTVFTNFKVGSLDGISILYGKPEGDTQKTLVVLLRERGLHWNFKDSSKTVFLSTKKESLLSHYLISYLYPSPTDD